MTQRQQYEAAAAVLVRESGVTVRKTRKRSSGVAMTASDDWGIEAPAPTGPIGFAVFAHEVAHQVLHRHGSRPRWLEEIEAWEYALEQFVRFELPHVERARAKAARSLRYAAGKAARRCSPKTARAIVDRMPAWAFVYDDPRDAVTSDVFELLVKAGAHL